MSVGCNCNVGLSNTGKPNCVPVQSVTSKLILVPLVSNAGITNKIDLTAPFVVPVWSSLINQIDASLRWYPLPNFENVELAKADTVFEEANSGKMAFLRQGKRSFAGELWASDSTPTFLGKLASGRCVEFGVYIVDVNGSLIGSKVGNYLYPITVDNQSWDPKFMFATDTTVQKIMLGFDFDRFFDESTMYMITSDEAGQDFNDLNGLIDVNLDVTAQVTTASITFDATFDYGTAVNPLRFKGGILADFALFNLSTNAPLIPTAVSEINDGEYTLLASYVSGDDYRLRVVKTGFTGETTFLAV
jgi:hypothetical protein